MATEKLMIQIGDETQELKGADKEAFIADREATAQANALLEAEQAAKQEARTSALTKLATIAGLNEEEMTALGL
jgi:phosphotransferase system IIA component